MLWTILLHAKAPLVAWLTNCEVCSALPRIQELYLRYLKARRMILTLATLAGFTFHPMVLMFALSGSLMISRIRIPKL